MEAAPGFEPGYGALQAQIRGPLDVAAVRKAQVMGRMGSVPSELVQGSRGIHAA
jgi:hypothetical protein